jgi:hypothetical protein
MPTRDIIKLKEKRRRYYLKHKDRILAKVRSKPNRERVKARRNELKNWIISLKTKCLWCTENHPAALDFHHKDKNEKTFSISDAVQYGFSKERILKEIVKCDVICSNCHRKHHWNLQETGR